MRLVIDTNVLVSALLTPTGVPARLMERVATGGHEVLLDKRILDEYRRVLERPEFSFEVTVVRSLLDALESPA